MPVKGKIITFKDVKVEEERQKKVNEKIAQNLAKKLKAGKKEEVKKDA